MTTYSDNIEYKLNTINDKFYSALDDFSNSYINYKMFPGQNEYQQIYLNAKGIIESLQADVFIATNEVQNNIDNLTDLISDLNTKISSEKSKNTLLKSKLNEVSSDSNGSGLLLNESLTLYFNKNLSNITMTIGIIIVFITTFTVYSQNKQTVKII
jgi:hypothetical protein